MGAFAGCVSVKTERNQQDMEEARAEKRVKVESGEDAKPGEDHVAKERDHPQIPLVQGAEVSTAAPSNYPGLAQLLHDLDDASDSDDFDDDFGVGSPLLPEALCEQWLGYGGIKESGVQAHSPQAAETVTTAQGSSSEHARTDDAIGTLKVQAHTPHAETSTRALGFSAEQAQRDACDIATNMRADTSQPGTITRAKFLALKLAQRQGDVGTNVQAHSPRPGTITRAQYFALKLSQIRDGDIGTSGQAHTPQPESSNRALDLNSSEQGQGDDDMGTKDVQAHGTIRREKPNTENVILDSDSDDDDDFQSMFHHPGETSQLKNTVNAESSRKSRETNISQLESAVKIDPESREQPEMNFQWEKAVKVEPESLRQPEKSSQLLSTVKLELGVVRQEPAEYAWSCKTASAGVPCNRGKCYSTFDIQVFSVI